MNRKTKTVIPEIHGVWPSEQLESPSAKGICWFLKVTYELYAIWFSCEVAIQFCVLSCILNKQSRSASCRWLWLYLIIPKISKSNCKCLPRVQHEGMIRSACGAFNGFCFSNTHSNIYDDIYNRKNNKNLNIHIILIHSHIHGIVNCQKFIRYNYRSTCNNIR